MGEARCDPLCFRKRTALVHTPRLPRRSLAFLPRNDMVCCPRTVHRFNPYFFIARAWPVAIHCELISEETSLNASHETRSIAASDCRPSRNDKMHVVTEPHCPYASIACSGLPRRSLAFLPRNDKESGVPNRLSHNSRSCHREG